MAKADGKLSFRYLLTLMRYGSKIQGRCQSASISARLTMDEGRLSGVFKNAYQDGSLFLRKFLLGGHAKVHMLNAEPPRGFNLIVVPRSASVGVEHLVWHDGAGR